MGRSHTIILMIVFIFWPLEQSAFLDKLELQNPMWIRVKIVPYLSSVTVHASKRFPITTADSILETQEFEFLAKTVFANNSRYINILSRIIKLGTRKIK